MEAARLLLDGTDHGLGELGGACTALCPMVGQHAFDAELGAELLSSAISASVSLEKRLMETTTGTPYFCTLPICRSRLAKPFSTASTFSFLRSSLATPPCILSARMVATITTQSGLSPGFAAFDVEELLGAEIGAEAGLGHHIIAELERGLGGDHRVAAVRDIGERTAVNEGGVVLKRLYQIGCERILEQRGHRAGCRQFLGGDGLLVAGLADLDLAEAALEIGEVCGEAEDRHYLGRHGDVEAGLAREAVGGAAERGDDGAQRAVVHVDGATPGDAAGVDVELVAPIDVIVDQAPRADCWRRRWRGSRR